MNAMTMLCAGILGMGHPGDFTAQSNSGVRDSFYGSSIAPGGCYSNPASGCAQSNCTGGQCRLSNCSSGAACASGRCDLFGGTGDCPNGQCGLRRPAGVYDAYPYQATRRWPSSSYPANPALNTGRPLRREYQPRPYGSIVPVSNALPAPRRVYSNSTTPFFD